MKIVTIDCANIIDEASFHKLFKDEFGFPESYGVNMDAWTDCMTSLDMPEDGMSKIHVDHGRALTLQLKNILDFKKRCPEMYDALVACSAFVNWRRIERGSEPVLALSFYE